MRCYMKPIRTLTEELPVLTGSPRRLGLKMADPRSETPDRRAVKDRPPPDGDNGRAGLPATS
ncbi:hypothetical protein EYF80_065904 [Liparis tanakae]|uniref:Uncharacterized protein n=1 Tax=Liparis tanakae TaxID=230148 RepID=A0A4Z2E5P6_9TELE|nr:hypothetical protein EYF80_065904 [Liparis tanakae]